MCSPTAADPKGAVLVIHENRGSHAPHPVDPAASRSRRLHGARHRPAVRGRRHRSLPSEGDATAALGHAPADRHDRRSAGRARRTATSRSRRQAGRDRLLLRWRDDVAVVGRRRAAAVGGRPVLRADTGRRRLQWFTERRRARHLRRAGLAGQRLAGHRPTARSKPPGWSTRSACSPASTTPSSTTPVRATTPSKPRRRTRRCWTGSASTSVRRHRSAAKSARIALSNCSLTRNLVAA